MAAFRNAHEVQRSVQDVPSFQEPRRRTPELFALSRWNNEVAANRGRSRFAGKMGRSGVDALSPEFREQARSRSPEEMAGIPVSR